MGINARVHVGIFLSVLLFVQTMTEQSTEKNYQGNNIDNYSTLSQSKPHGDFFHSDTMTLFNFTTVNNVDDWMESSDTVREVGMSKAVITLQKTKLFQRAVFFTLLNPQENGAGFAGVRTLTNFNLTSYDTIDITCRVQGNKFYKVVLRHRGMHRDSDIAYEQFFSFPAEPSEMFTVKSLPLSNFEAYFRGRRVPDADPLDTSNITMFGLQIYGGVYLPIKQKGLGSLEIETIVAKRRASTLLSSSTPTLDEGLKELTLIDQ